MTGKEVMRELESLGNPQTKKTLLNHGAVEPFFGVRIGDMQPMVKKIKKNYELSLELFDTKNGDAQYLAGLIVDEKKMTIEDLQHWVEHASWHMVSEYAVAWIAAESNHGRIMANLWIQSSDEKIASAGWNTWASICTISLDDNLDKIELKKLLDLIEKNIHTSHNRVRYTMNNFLMACGQCVGEMYEPTMNVAKRIGEVKVNVGNTACKVHDAAAYLQKMKDAGSLGKKKKKARC